MPRLVWLVTGCSSGFGEQFVHSILNRGDKVIATARRLEKIKHLKEIGVDVLQLDLTDDQETLNDTLAKAINVYGQIDVLINNASYISIGAWEDLGYEDFLAQFDTNVFGTIKVTRALLPHFRQRRSGNIVFIGSLSGWVGHPGCGAYAGSKFALEGTSSSLVFVRDLPQYSRDVQSLTPTETGLVEALDREIAHFGIKTLLIEPGRFRTKLLSGGNLKAASSNISDYEDFSNALLEGLGKEDQAQPGDPARLVDIVLDLVRHEGVAAGREIPFRLPLGIDVYDDIKTKCEQTLRLLEEWRAVIRSTDHS